MSGLKSEPSPQTYQNAYPYASVPVTPVSAFAPSLPPLSAPSASQSPAGDASTYTPDAERCSKPKQKRNKPTLSCEECVERKTKVGFFPLFPFHVVFPLFPFQVVFHSFLFNLFFHSFLFNLFFHSFLFNLFFLSCFSTLPTPYMV
jgi:hypothetical protein